VVVPSISPDLIRPYHRGAHRSGAGHQCYAAFVGASARVQLAGLLHTDKFPVLLVFVDKLQVTFGSIGFAAEKGDRATDLCFGVLFSLPDDIGI